MAGIDAAVDHGESDAVVLMSNTRCAASAFTVLRD